MKLTFPHMGNTYITAKALLDDLGVEYIIPPSNNKKALELGTKLAPELACLPLKINLGNYIQAYEKGADTILITGGCGPCRFGYYCEMEREILKDNGYDMDVITIEMPDQGVKELYNRIKKLAGGFNLPKLMKALKNTAQVSRQVDELEKLSYWVRPREAKKGSTDKIYNAFQNSAKTINGSTALKELIRETENKLRSVEVDKDYIPLKVGIVGEIYTTIDSYTSFNMDVRLGNMGIEVNRAVTVSGWVIDHIIKGALHLPRDMSYAEVAKPYLGTMIGGHAQETIGNTILYARNGYDGVIQIYPLTCMPEIVAESILPAVERDFNIPILTLIIDEMTVEAGYLTRLEAYVDLLNKRRERAAFEGEWLLSGN
jgi:predicted nucleotide-binding protein (sugar kinase/HSP70/actin superfamily)